jgi:hypothetical protein
MDATPRSEQRAVSDETRDVWWAGGMYEVALRASKVVDDVGEGREWEEGSPCGEVSRMRRSRVRISVEMQMKSFLRRRAYTSGPSGVLNFL